MTVKGEFVKHLPLPALYKALNKCYLPIHICSALTLWLGLFGWYSVLQWFVYGLMLFSEIRVVEEVDLKESLHIMLEMQMKQELAKISFLSTSGMHVTQSLLRSTSSLRGYTPAGVRSMASQKDSVLH